MNKKTKKKTKSTTSLHPLLDLATYFDINKSNQNLHSDNCFYLIDSRYKRNKNNHIKNVSSILREKYGNFTKINDDYMAFETDKGYVVAHILMHPVTKYVEEIGTILEFFDDKMKVKESFGFIFYKTKIKDKRYIESMFKKIDKISESNDESLTQKNVLKKIEELKNKNKEK